MFATQKKEKFLAGTDSAHSRELANAGALGHSVLLSSSEETVPKVPRCGGAMRSDSKFAARPRVHYNE